MRDLAENDSIGAKQSPKLLDYLLLSLLYFLSAKFCILYTLMPEGIVTLWLPNSVLLAVLIRFEFRGFIYMAALVIAAEIAADLPSFTLTQATLFGVINVGEATLAYLLLRRLHFAARLSDLTDVTKLVIAGPIIASLTGAIFGAFVYSYFRGTETSYLEFLRIWWFGDGLGLMIFTPMLVSWWPRTNKVDNNQIVVRWYDGLVALGAVAAVVLLVLAKGGVVFDVHVRPLLLLPFVLYVAARCELRWTSLAVAAASLLMVILMTSGHLPFGNLPPSETVIVGQEFIFIVSLISFGLTALLMQLRTQQAELQLVNLSLSQLNQELEERVVERTGELHAANLQLVKLAATDALTGVCNRRELTIRMAHEMELCRRHHRNLAVIMFDLDHFKIINDRYGHRAGDVVLQHTASLVSKTVRSIDTLARYGGEEFVLLLPENTLDEAIQLAERLREMLSTNEILIDDNSVQITASFGLTMLLAEDKKPWKVLQRADKALYAAKHAGRNCVAVARYDKANSRIIYGTIAESEK